jgi:hypothetical protein
MGIENYALEFGKLESMVKIMREAQGDYSKVRSSENRILAERTEKRVDDYLDDIARQKENQTELFGYCVTGGIYE